MQSLCTIRWHQEGIEALLFDDGKDVDRVTAVKSRQKIAIKDLYDLLEEKYSHLRQKLIWQMVSVTSGKYNLPYSTHYLSLSLSRLKV